MMETLEQQQTKITSNLESHVGGGEGEAAGGATTATPTAAASEEEDYEDNHSNVPEVEEEEETSERSQCSKEGVEVDAAPAAAEKDVKSSEELAIDLKEEEEQSKTVAEELEEQKTALAIKLDDEKKSEEASTEEVDIKPDEQAIAAVIEDKPALTRLEDDAEPSAVNVVAIKVESCDEEEAEQPAEAEAEQDLKSEQEEEAPLNDIKANAKQAEEQEAPLIKPKVNGAHAEMPLETTMEEEEEEEEEEDEVEDKPAVIANCEEMEVETPQQPTMTDVSMESEETAAGEDENSSSCSAMSEDVVNDATGDAESTTDSSTSQQLVIDQSESEQNARLQPLKLSLKRRRSASSAANELRVKRAKPEIAIVEAPQMAAEAASPALIEQPQEMPPPDALKSLLLQRLQQPLQLPASTALTDSEMSSMLTCFKCNAQNFENFQQLNEHFSMCNVWPGSSTKAAPPPAPPPPPALEAAALPPPPSVELAEPAAPLQPRKSERFFRCSRCSTVHQCWNFFLHMRNIHQRYICLYCSHVYATVEKLSLHLENKHDIDQSHFVNDTWLALQRQEQRARHLICCTCQATFERGAPFEDHDCAELMQPCTLCGQKGCHTNGCRNSSKRAGKRKRKAKRKKPEETATEAAEAAEQPNIPDLPDAPDWSAPAVEEALPKLVVPKIMLRVPKEFQKSVDAALSSTDTEEEEAELEAEAEAEETAGEVSAIPPAATEMLEEAATPEEEEQPALNFEAQAVLSEDTETATETASLLHDTTPPSLAAAEPEMELEMEPELDDSPTAKLTRVLAEIERTKLDIQRTKADMLKKQQHKLTPGQEEEEEEEALEQQQPPQPAEGRWSPTPPASPHNNHIEQEQQQEEQQQQQYSKQLEEQPEEPQPMEQQPVEPAVEQPPRRDTLGSECMDLDESINEAPPSQPEESQLAEPEELSEPIVEPPLPPADGIEVAPPETHTVDLLLDRPLDKFEMVDFVRLCLKAVYPLCLYCNHARRIAVNGKQLVLHMIALHRFTATVDSITAEELHAETIVAKLKSYLPALEEEHLNAASYCTVEGGKYAEPFNERIYECFQCRYVTSTHKELYTHNRRLHIKSNILCFMCRTNFYSYSEILCHICPGDQQLASVYDLKFRCCLCETAELPSAFRLMVHLRKQHFACDICLEDCHSQVKLSSHVWKHKLLHLCYRCGIAYRNKQDISKHLFWKHGTESSSCKRCLQKRWRHVYHFCVPPVEFSCEQCSFKCSKAIYLEVHKREHAGDFRYACNEEQCEEKFVSRRLLLKHAIKHEPEPGLKAIGEEEQEKTAEQEKLSMEEQLPIKNEEGESVKQAESEKKANEGEAVPKLEKEEQTVPATEEHQQEQPKESKQAEAAPRKRRKKAKRNKESLEDLNLIAPNLSESDSSDDSDSDAPRSSQMEPTLPMRAPTAVEDLDMPKVMLSPASESDNEQPMEEQEQKEKTEQKEAEADKAEAKLEPLEKELEAKAEPKLEEEKQQQQLVAEDVPDIWKNLLQNQGAGGNKVEQIADNLANYSNSEDERCPRPVKLHVARSDHDYCKLLRTPPATPAKVKGGTPKTPKRSRHNSQRGRAGSDDSDSDSSSSSSSNSDSSSCSCGSNCSCSSSSSGPSSSSDSSSDDSDSSRGTSSPLKRPRKKSLRGKKSAEALAKASLEPAQPVAAEEEDINVTAVFEEERPPSPPKPPAYNESDFDTAVSDTDEEFYDAHPQKMASELLAQKRAALLADRPQLLDQTSYDIVENSRPSTPSLPEEAAAFAEKRERAKGKKKKRERKSTCRSSTTPQKANASLLPPSSMTPSLTSLLPEPLPTSVEPEKLLHHSHSHHSHIHAQLTPQLPLTPLTHRLPSTLTRMSEGSSCSDADGTLKRSKRQRRPNKFYGYTSDDENMASVLAPPLQVGMQLIKPQPPPQLTWAKEDLPSPAKSILNQSRSKGSRSTPRTTASNGGTAGGIAGSLGYLHSNGNSEGSSRKQRQKRTLLSGGGGATSSRKRPAKRSRPGSAQLPPIPTLKIRPALLPAAGGPSDSSDSSSGDDEDGEINVTSLLPALAAVTPAVPSGIATPQQQHLNSLLPPPVAPPVPPPSATAFNQPIPPALLPNPDFATLQYFKANNIRYPIRPPAGARLAREGESVYCYCRCPYDEVSEMIACDGDNCLIEWFHFECVGIMVAPQGKWFCAECRPKYSEGLYHQSAAAGKGK